MEEVRKALANQLKNTVALEKNLPALKDAAQTMLPLVTILCKKVDVAIGKMKPLGGS